MKRALALLAACSLFGFAGLAQITGSWSTSLTFNFLEDFDEFITLSSEFVLDYTVEGLTLGMDAEFDGDVGFSGLDFTASGAIGPLTIESTMSFVPNYVTGYDYTYTGELIQTESLPWSKRYEVVTVAKTFEPRFDEWTVDVSLEFGGLTFGTYFFLEALDDGYETDDIWYYDGNSLVQTVSHAVVNPNCLTTIGSGWKFTVSGTVNGVTVTSYTYFNLLELDARWSTNPKYGLNLGKRGIFYIPNAGCTVGFYEEYLMVEGLSLCCGTTVDAALKVTCSGFDYLKFLVKDIPFPCCGIDLDLGVRFGLIEKSVSFVFDVADLENCLGIDLDLVTDGSAVSGIRVKSIDINCEFAECLSFSATTVLYKDTAGLFSLKTLTSDEEYHFFVPAYCFSTTEAVEKSDKKGLWTEVDVPLYKWMAWESFTVELCGPACCGEEYEVEITTYFGNKWELKAWGFKYADGEKDILEGTWQASGYTGAPTISDPTKANTLATGSVYVEQDPSSLFNWMATEASLSLPLIGDVLSLDLGAFISVRGFESFDFGFTFEF